MSRRPSAPKLDAVSPVPLIDQIRPAKKTIDVNSASLVDLKVELARKQNEFRHQALDPEHRLKSKKTSKGPAFLRAAEAKNPGVAARDARDRDEQQAEAVDLDKSRRALEAKAALYEKLQRNGPLGEGEAEAFLVDFEAKAAEGDGSGGGAGPAVPPPPPPPPPENDDDWVEYKDAFGRDRRCRRRELASRLAAEHEAIARQQHGQPPPPPPPAGQPPPPPASGQLQRPELLSGDMARELERQRWEGEAATAADRGPVGPLHFQGVVPGEIRQLGTGYFRFSTDEEKRAAQMNELSALRDQTSEQRRRSEALKKRRQAAQEARVAKIRKRKGLAAPDDATDQGRPAHANGGAAAGASNDAPAAQAASEPSTVDELLAFYKMQAAQDGSGRPL